MKIGLWGWVGMTYATSLPEEFSLLQLGLCRLTDRRFARGKVLPSAGVSCLTALALMCGYRSLSAIHRFGDTYPELSPDLKLTRSPSVPTLSRLLRMVSVGELCQPLMRFALELALQRRCGVGVVAMDGKTMGGVWEGGEQLRVLHLFSQESTVALDQVAVKGHLDEPRVAQAWIEQGAGRIEGLRVRTGYALYADVDLCQAIVDRGKDYVVKLKKTGPSCIGT